MFNFLMTFYQMKLKLMGSEMSSLMLLKNHMQLWNGGSVQDLTMQTLDYLDIKHFHHRVDL